MNTINTQPIMRLNNKIKFSGFTLVEMSIVLVIVALLLGGLLPVISGQIEQQRRNETRRYMDEVRDALLGYAVSHKYLPCPDTSNPADGIANAPCNIAATQQFGTLPYNDLGVGSKDAYGSVLVYAVNKDFASSAVPFTLTTSTTTATAMQICSTDNCAPPHLTSTAVAVIISRGANWGSATSTPETENINGPTTGDRNFVSHDFVQNGFDDLVVWLSPNILINRMVTAGQLP